MVERRLASLEAFASAPIPRWDRTDLSAIDFDTYRQAAQRVLAGSGASMVADLTAMPLEASSLGGEPVPVAVAEALEEAERGGAVIAHVVPSEPDRPLRVMRRLSPEWQRRGVRLLSLDEAMRGPLEDAVRQHFMTDALLAGPGKFEAWHAAAWDTGTLLLVPKGVQLEEEHPIQIVYWAGAARAVTAPHTLIVLEEEAHARVVESWTSPDPGTRGGAIDGLAPLVVGGVEIVAGPDSRLDYTSLQTLGHHALSFTRRRAVLDRGSQVEWVLGEFGCRLARGEFETVMDGPGSSSHSVMVFFADGEQHLDLLNSMEHRGEHSESDIVARGVLAGGARGICRAVTHIRRGARDSGAYQRGNILVLTKQARADANPTVLVEENEVRRAGHAATVGQVDREQLFYLMSRGLPEKVAVRLIVEGFLQPVLERIPIRAVHDRIRQLVAAKLEGT